MMDGMSTDQVRGWMAASMLDPFPEDRVEYMLAQLIALVANKLRGKDEQPYSATDFIPQYAASVDDIAEAKSKRLRAKMEFVKMKRSTA